MYHPHPTAMGILSTQGMSRCFTLNVKNTTLTAYITAGISVWSKVERVELQKTVLQHFSVCSLFVYSIRNSSVTCQETTR